MSWKVLSPMPSAARALPAAVCRDQLMYLDLSARVIMRSRFDATLSGSTPFVAASPPLPGSGAIAIVTASLFVVGDWVYVMSAVDTTALAGEVVLSQASTVWKGRVDLQGDISTWVRVDALLPEPIAQPNIVKANGAIFVCGGVKPHISVTFASQTVNFVVGEKVTGGSSGATGVVDLQVDSGATGTLYFKLDKDAVGTFTNGETLTGNQGGSATASSGSTLDTSALCVSCYRATSMEGGWKRVTYGDLPSSFALAGGIASAGSYVYMQNTTSLFQGQIVGNDTIIWNTITTPYSSIFGALVCPGDALLQVVGFAGGVSADVRVVPLDANKNFTPGSSVYKTQPLSVGPLFQSGLAFDPERNLMFLVGGENGSFANQTTVVGIRLPRNGFIDGQSY
jgi:hypothetical protein